MGKDSTALLWLMRKAFLGDVPMPVVQLDTGMELPEVYAFRDRIAREWNLDLRVEQCPPEDACDPALPPQTRAAARKTEGLRALLAREGYRAVFVGIRRDEQATRAKERIVSPRSLDGGWNVREQPPEFWGYTLTDIPHGGHVRVHPLLAWTELDVWRYHAPRRHPVRVALSRARRTALPLAGREEHHGADCKRRGDARRDHRGAGRDARTRTRRAHDGSRERGVVRAAAHGRVHVSADARIVVLGHVDHGKSTLIGRLLHDTGALAPARIDEIVASSRRRGLATEWSFALDALQDERDQAVTIDTTRIWFRLGERRFAIIDAPGHEEFLANAMTGASDADAAILVVDAERGVEDQTRRHIYLLGLLDVAHVIVAVNKIDAVVEAIWSGSAPPATRRASRSKRSA